MDYRSVANDIYKCIGGRENIVSAAHCATRLRLVIADNAKCSKKELENIDGVKACSRLPDSFRSFLEPER